VGQGGRLVLYLESGSQQHSPWRDEVAGSVRSMDAVVSPQNANVPPPSSAPPMGTGGNGSYSQRSARVGSVQMAGAGTPAPGSGPMHTASARRPPPMKLLAPVDRLSVLGWLWLVGLQGLMALIINAGINFGIHVPLYLDKLPVLLWSFPNPIAGVCACGAVVALSMQCAFRHHFPSSTFSRACRRPGCDSPHPGACL